MLDIEKIKGRYQSILGFRLIELYDSAMVLHWRNSEHIRLFMNNTEIISQNTHDIWFEQILRSKKDLYFIYQLDDNPIGLLCFNKIDQDKHSAEWGFYLGVENLPKGTGTKMLLNAIELAKVIGLKELTATVIGSNTRSHHIHQKLGFEKAHTSQYLIKL